MITIEIDGQKIQVTQGSMIIEAADSVGIKIPRFCYHKRLSVAANCRMCLVDVEKAPKPLPACATPVTDGMRVSTKTGKAIEAQKGVMEFLLINHPLDCPICDQGGECELQDIAMGYGKDVSRYQEGKRVVIDKNIGPLISTDMTRCIHCTRCVRFGTEVAGVRELGATGRGEHTNIGTFIASNVNSEVSGNVIDLCPVGALTSKPFRYSARTWELTQKPTISPHDCIGTNIYTHIRRNEVMRVVPKENFNLNDVWIADRDRFSYTALTSKDRLKEPHYKENGVWSSISWDRAFSILQDKITTIVKKHGADKLGALISPSASLEELYLLQKILRHLGSNNIDHRCYQQDFSYQEHYPLFPHLGLYLPAIDDLEGLLLIGSAIHKEQPLLGVRIRSLAVDGGQVFTINPFDCEFNFPVAEKIIAKKVDMLTEVAGVAKAIVDATKAETDSNITNLLASVTPSDEQIKFANSLQNAKPLAIMLGMLAQQHPDFGSILALSNLIAKQLGAKFGVITYGSNTAGAWLTGAIPHRLPNGENITKPGLNARTMFTSKLPAYILHGIEPNLDCALQSSMDAALTAAELVVAITSFRSQYLDAKADLLLPLAPFTETAGTYINVTGTWQTTDAVIKPDSEVKPGWKIYRVLANKLGVPDCNYNTAADILSEFTTKYNKSVDLDSWNIEAPKSLHSSIKGNIVRIAPIPLYSVDQLVRRSLPLQSTDDAESIKILLNSATAKRCGITDAKASLSSDNFSVVLPVEISESIPDECILVNSATIKTAGLSPAYAALEVKGA